MAKARKKSRAMRSRRSGVKSQKRVNLNNEIIKKISSSL